MVVEFSFDDEGKVVDLLNSFSKRDINWIMFGYDENPNVVRVLSTGKGGFGEVEGYLKEDALVYFLLGISPEDEGEYTQVKNILSTWVGPKTEPLKKALSSQHRNHLYQFVKKHTQLHGELQALQRSEINETLLKEKLTLSKARDEDFLVKSRLIDEEKKRQREEEERKKGKSAMYSFVGTSSAEEDSPFADGKDDEAIKAIKDVGDETTKTNFAVFKYTANKKDIVVEETGQGVIADFSKHFEINNIVYVLYSMVFADGEYSVFKRVLLTWVGQRVKPLHKARSSQHRATLYKFVNKLTQLTGEFHALEGLDSISEDLVRQKMEGTKVSPRCAVAVLWKLSLC